jgi:hypothetical protein
MNSAEDSHKNPVMGFAFDITDESCKGGCASPRGAGVVCAGLPPVLTGVFADSRRTGSPGVHREQGCQKRGWPIACDCRTSRICQHQHGVRWLRGKGGNWIETSGDSSRCFRRRSIQGDQKKRAGRTMMTTVKRRRNPTPDSLVECCLFRTVSHRCKRESCGFGNVQVFLERCNCGWRGWWS